MLKFQLKKKRDKNKKKWTKLIKIYLFIFNLVHPSIKIKKKIKI